MDGRHKALGAGGKPSTWLPPGGHEEEERQSTYKDDLIINDDLPTSYDLIGVRYILPIVILAAWFTGLTFRATGILGGVESIVQI